jgi:hypothetical protein
VLHGAFRYEILTNALLPEVCPICSAILDRRISNMPKERKTISSVQEVEDREVPESQLDMLLGLDAGKSDNKRVAEDKQFELF